MGYKKFTLTLLSILVIFILFNFIVWNLSTKHILQRDDGYITGDLARMGYITTLLDKRKNRTNLSKLHFEVNNYKYQKLDMVTLGDSFSNGAGGGLNRYYQDYLATYLDWNILNINKYKKYSNINTIIAMINSGFLKKMGVKYFIYEATQRKVVDRLTTNINFGLDVDIKEIEEFYNFGKSNKSQSSLEIPKVSFINNGNFKYIVYNLLYHFSDHAFISKTYIAKTDRKFFSIKPYNEFLFYKKDITSIHKNSEDNLKAVNENLNRLARRLRQDGIGLIFMPVVNKFDLYSSYIISAKYPKDPFFEIFDKLKKDYIYVDTKKILLEKLKKGEIDIFYADDLHWTHKASKSISEYLVQKIDSIH